MSAESRWLLALRVCAAQLIFTVVVAMLWWLFGGSALAALAGGGLVTFLSLWFAMRVFGVDAAADPQGFLRRLYRAELFKFVMVILFFVAAARIGGEHMVEITTGFIAAVVGFWFGLWPAMRAIAVRTGQSGDK